MKKILPLILIILFFSGLIFILYRSGLFNKSPARLEVSTTPASQVYINGEDSGTTPYIGTKLKSGSYTIKLVPQSSGISLSSYETSLTLSAGDSTVINHVFAQAQSDSYGYTLELKAESVGGTYLSIVTDPDKANITVDGIPKGYSPLSKFETTPGSHSLTLSSPGYKPQDISVNALVDHNLIIKAKLGADLITLTPPPVASTAAETADTAETASPSPSSSPVAEVAKPYVLIQDTGTGWLRVRGDPSASGEELGKADIGSKLPYLGETSESGWHKVKFDDNIGWVSGRYATLVK